MMTPRERWYRVSSHPPKWPDRVCKEFVGGLDTVSPLDQEPYGLKAIADYVGVPEYADPQPNPIWGYTKVDERILEKFNCDFRYLPVSSPSVYGDPEDWRYLPDGWIQTGCGVLWKPGYGASRQGVRRMMVAPDDQQPAAKLKTLKDIEEYPYWPKTDDQKTRQALEEKACKAGKIAKKMHEETDYAISGQGFGYSTEQHYRVRGFSQWLMDIKRDREFYHAFATKLWEISKDLAEIYLNQVGDHVDRVSVTPGDLGTQSGPMVSLEDFREFVLPYMKKSLALVRKHTKARTYAHACGSIHLYIKDLADAGLDMIGQQITPYTFHMEPERLRRDYGGVMTFWGGMDAQAVLTRCTPDQIRDWVRRVIYALAPGHVVASNHAIQGDVPPQNIWAANEAVEEFSRTVYGND
jgi:uroporphyrinogen-III decarboxylase